MVRLVNPGCLNCGEEGWVKMTLDMPDKNITVNGWYCTPKCLTEHMIGAYAAFLTMWKETMGHEPSPAA